MDTVFRSEGFNLIDQGITYVAWGRGVEQAVRSALSAQRFGYRTCLITNESVRASCFERLIRVEGPLSTPSHKVAFYPLSPWETTLYLDTDTLVLNDLDFGFRQARLHGLAMAIAPACYLGPHWGLSVDPDIQQYNAGVIFYHRSHDGFSGLWTEVMRILDEEFVEGVHPAPVNDQSALSLHLSRSQKHPFVLNPNWNLRPQFGMRHGFGPIKIWHCDVPPPRTLNDERFWSIGNPYLRPAVLLSNLWIRVVARLRRELGRVTRTT